jgi:hypothetical protein
MNNLLKQFVVLFLLSGIYGCSKKVVPHTGEVNFLYKEAQGTIGIKSIGYGKNKKQAVEDAQKKAFLILLFKGIPGTELNIPLVQNEYETRAKHSSYFTTLLDEGNYRTYIMSSAESSALSKAYGTKKIAVDIKINYNSLRKDLEQNQVIRKFGL